MVPDSADVVVIGGGIIGLATTWELARRGHRPVLLERLSSTGLEQSGRNWGFVRQPGRSAVELPLAVESSKLWGSLEDRLEQPIGFARRGSLQLARDEGAIAQFQTWTSAAQEFSINSRVVDRHEVQQLLPGVVGPWCGGMYTASDAQAEPRDTVRAFTDAALRLGARIVTGVTARNLTTQHGRITGVVTDHRHIRTSHVVVASGIWSRRVLRTAQVDLPLQWIRATVAETEIVPDMPDIPTVWDRHVSFRKTASGSVLFALGGATDIDVMPSALNHLRDFSPTLTKNFKEFRVRVGRPLFEGVRRSVSKKHAYAMSDPLANRRNVRQSAEALRGMFSVLSDVRVARSWAGYIDGTPDGLPVLSVVPGRAGLVVATGFSGHGFGLAPVIGTAVADLVDHGSTSAFELVPFRLTRFAERDFQPPEQINR